jgi:hypothetical protein
MTMMRTLTLAALLLATTLACVSSQRFTSLFIEPRRRGAGWPAVAHHIFHRR